MTENKTKQFLIKNKGQVEDFNQIKRELTNLIQDNTEYHLKNIIYDGFTGDNSFAWFVDLMEYDVSMELVKLVHNYFGGDCIITTGDFNGNIRLIFKYTDVGYVRMNMEDNVI